MSLLSCIDAAYYLLMAYYLDEDYGEKMMKKKMKKTVAGGLIKAQGSDPHLGEPSLETPSFSDEHAKIHIKTIQIVKNDIFLSFLAHKSYNFPQTNSHSPSLNLNITS